MTGAASIHEYAIAQMNHLLARLAFQVHRAAQTPGPDQIHDLRVSVRRFSQGLRVFADFFPAREVKQVRRMLKRMLRLTSEIRNRDIALEFLARWERPEPRARLKQERGEFQRQFSEMARRWSARDFPAKWRNSLLLRSL